MWGMTTPPKQPESSKQPPFTGHTFRASPDWLDRLARAAEARGQTISQFIRFELEPAIRAALGERKARRPSARRPYLEVAAANPAAGAPVD
jgi:hypothetical protein